MEPALLSITWYNSCGMGYDPDSSLTLFNRIALAGTSQGQCWKASRTKGDPVEKHTEVKLA
jgi:hypothetical protein